MLILTYALRNIWRRKRESLLIAFVVFVSAHVILTQAAQRRGVEERARKVLVEAVSGEYLLARENPAGIDLLDAQFDEMEPFRATPAQLRAAEKAAGGASIEPRIRFGGLLSSGEQSMGIGLQAVTPAQLARLDGALDFESGGIQPHTPDGLLLSDAVAEHLKVSAGDTLVVLVTNRDGYVSDDLLVVSGVFASRGAASFLTGVGYLPYARGAALLNLDAHQTMELVATFAGPDARGDRAARLARAAAGIAPGVKATSWEETAPLFFAVLRVWRGAGAATQGVFCALSFLLLLNVVLTKVNGRRREIGTLRALGHRHAWIATLVSMEYLLLAWGGFLAALLMVGGTVAAFAARGIPIPSPAMQAAYMGTRLYPRLTPGDVLWVWALFTAVTAVACALPLQRFRRADPSHLLRVGT